MCQNQMGGLKMIEGDVGDTFDLPVPGNYNRGYAGGLANRGVDGDKTLDSPGQQDVRVLAQQFRVMMMHYRNEEVLAFAESGFNAADYHTAVGVANFRRDNANGKRALLAQ